MSSSVRFTSTIVSLFTVLLAVQHTFAGDLVKAPKQMVKYKLSNLRVERDLPGQMIVFDYERVREGTGTVRLAARSDQGRVGIHGFGMRFEKSGTVRLRDSFASLRSAMRLMNGGDGIEFYLISDDMPFDLPYGTGGKQYLVSNAISHGRLNTKLAARDLTKQELEAAERIRIARMPPETVPTNYQRATSSTKLVPGAPVKFGVAGQWQDAEVVSVADTGFIKLWKQGDTRLSMVPLKDWIAVSDSTMQQIRTSPDRFSSDVRILADGNLVLAPDVLPLTSLKEQGRTIQSLPKGVPLVLERNNKWQTAYLTSVDEFRVRLLVNDPGRPRVEFVPHEKLAIREQTLKDLNDPEIVKAFAENLDAFESRAIKLPGDSGSMETVGALDPAMNANPFETPKAETDAPLRTWKDASGSFEVKGSLVSEGDTQVVIKREDGQSIEVPLKMLSESDREYLANQKKPVDANPFNNVIGGNGKGMATTEKQAGSESSADISVDFQTPMKVVRTVGDLGWGAASVATSPDNRFLLIGRKGSCASLIDLKTGAVLVDSGRMNHVGNVTACGFTPDGKHAVIGGQKGVFEVYTCDARGRMNLKQQFAAHAKEVTCLCFSADSRFALSGSADKEARYWDVSTGRQIASLSGFKGKVKATRITPDGSKLLATDGESLKVYDIGQSKVVREVKVGNSWASGQAAAISPNGLLLAVGDGYNFRLWNLVSFTELPTLEGTEIGWSAVFCPDNQHLISGANGVVNVWDARTQARVLSHPVGSSFYVQAIATSYDGTLISCPSAFKEVKVLQVAQ